MKKLYFVLVLSVFFGCSKKKSDPPVDPEPDKPKNEVVINGNTFTTVDIGTQTWTSIGHKGNTGSGNYTPDVWKYTRDQANNIIAPQGWRLPSKADVEKLFKFAGATGTWVELIETYSDNGIKTDIGTQFIAGNDVAVKFMSGTWANATPTNSLGFGAVVLVSSEAEYWCNDAGLASFIFYTNSTDKAVGKIKHLPSISPTGSKYLLKTASVRFVKDK